MGTIFRKYFSNPIRYILVYLFLPLIFVASLALVDIVYAMLLEIAPNLIPEYDKVLEKEAYLALTNNLNILAAILAIFFTAFATGVYDNARYEDVVKRTDGLFKIKEELSEYFKSVLPSDLIAAALPGLLFIPLTLPEYSKKFLDYFGFFLSPHLYLSSFFTPIGAYFVIFAVIFTARMLAMPKALSRHRALWLTSFVDG